MDRINIIQRKLEELRNIDKRFSIFGSSSHKYQLKRTLDENEIARIESENRIFISGEYRTILKYLGNGGAGCGYGLESLTLKNISPPYVGTKRLLRNWKDPQKIDLEMVNIQEITGYIKLFDYGCGMETCLIVNGEEQGGLIFFDCDGRFEKIEGKSILDIYENWLDESTGTLKRVENKLREMPLQEVIDSEWNLKNFSIKEMVLSIINAEPLQGVHSGNEVKEHLEKQYQKWKNKTVN